MTIAYPIFHVGRFARVRHARYLGRPTVFHSVEGWRGTCLYIWSRSTRGAFHMWEMPRLG